MIVQREPGPDTVREVADEVLSDPAPTGVVLDRDDVGELYEIEIYFGGLRADQTIAIAVGVSPRTSPERSSVLTLAITSEVAGTAGLKASEGFGRLAPSALAVLGYALAFYFLAQSLRYLPLGVAYAIWSGLGTMGSVLLGLLIWKEILGPVHILGIGLIVVGVVVLNVAPSH